MVSNIYAVDLNSVEKVFKNGWRALDRIDLRVTPGEFVSLIGPSGCGKSTLLKLIANLHAPSAGSVRWWGEDFQAVGKAGRQLSFVFQEATLMPWANVHDNVRLPLDLAHVDQVVARSRVTDALKQVGLDHMADAYPHQLSGGMQMRVSIARGLVTRPNLLLMDEPFGALDEFTRNRLDEDLAKLCVEQKLTTFFVTHSLYEAVFLSTRVLVMAARPGRIFAEYAIDPAIVRDEAFRLSDAFAEMCRDVTRLLWEASRTGTVSQEGLE